MDTVLQEILQDKIFLDATDNVVIAVDDAPDVETEFDAGGPTLDDL